MYTIKTKFKGQDMFTKTGFNHVGDVYTGNNLVLDERFKNKQFAVGTVNKYFSKFNSLNTVPGSADKYASDPYLKPTKFAPFKPNGKGSSGFGSKDASKREEFSNTEAVRVYREKLKSEQKYASIFAKMNMEKNGGDALDELVDEKTSNATQTQRRQKTVYESVFENDDDMKQLSFMKPKKHHAPMNSGGLKTSASLVGMYSREANLDGLRHGRKNKTKDFFDAGHLNS